MNWFSTAPPSTKCEEGKATKSETWKSPELTIDDIKGLVNFIAESTRLGKNDIEQFKMITPVYMKLCSSVKKHPDNFVIIKDVFVPPSQLTLGTATVEKETKRIKQHKLSRKKRKKKRS